MAVGRVVDALLNEPKTLEELQEGLGDCDVKALQEYLAKGVEDGQLEALCLVPGNVFVYAKRPVATNTPRGTQQRSSVSTPGTSARARLPFRSPARVSGHAASPGTPLSRSAKRPTTVALPTVEKLQEEIKDIKKRLDTTDQEVSELSQQYNEADLQTYIDKLHEYNEIKDAGQILVGKMAEVSGTTTALLYEQFDLRLDD